MPTKQHGQIRGYQVHYVRMVNGEPTGQPAIKDILIDDAQVRRHFSDKWSYFTPSAAEARFGLLSNLELN